MSKCEWIGQGERCSKEAVKDRSYCQDHVWRVYQQGTSVRRRKDKQRADIVFELQSLLDQAIAELESEGVL